MALLSGETAVVTGGSSGIGRAIARTFADRGADVVVADVVEKPRDDGTPTRRSSTATLPTVRTSRRPPTRPTRSAGCP